MRLQGDNPLKMTFNTVSLKWRTLHHDFISCTWSDRIFQVFQNFYATHFSIHVFQKGTAFPCNSIETILGVQRHERGVGAEDAIFLEFSNNALVQKRLSKYTNCKKKNSLKNRSSQPQAVRESTLNETYDRPPFIFATDSGNNIWWSK